MKQMRLIIAFAITILMCACEKEYKEQDTFSYFLEQTEWSITSPDNQEMYIYSFTSNTSGNKYRCYGNGRIIDYESFSWTYSSNLRSLAIQTYTALAPEEYTIVDYNQECILFADGSEWKSHTRDDNAGALYAGDEIPQDLFDHPEWYDFEEVRRWVWKEYNYWLDQDVAYVNKDKGLVAIKGEEQIRHCQYEDKTTIDVGDYSWEMNEGYYIQADGSNHYIISALRPLLELKDKQAVPDFVLTNPYEYGFQYRECWVEHYNIDLEYYLLFEKSTIFYNDKGAFLTPYPTNINCYVYRKWYTNSNGVSGEEGIYTIPQGTRYAYITDSDTGSGYTTYILFDQPTLERVVFLNDSHNINERGSSYSVADDVYATGACFMDVYDPEFSIDKVSISYSASWLWTAKVNIAYQETNHTRVRLLWANSANSGSNRTGYIYITVSNVKGETYYHTVTVNQQGPSGSGSGGTGGGSNEEATLGPEWVKGSAPGYLPYWYCPNTGKTIPYNPVSGNITIYRNSNTGAYKAAYAGKLYNAQRGYNKITISTEAHSVYDSTYDFWKSCLDRYYLEFTIY